MALFQAVRSPLLNPKNSTFLQKIAKMVELYAESYIVRWKMQKY